MDWRLALLEISLYIAVASCAGEKDQALFYKSLPPKKIRESKRVETPAESKTVEDILSWLQTRYREVNRRVRNEDLSRAYLPADYGTSTQAPRPFQTTKAQGIPSQGYRPSSSSSGFQKPTTVKQQPPPSYQPTYSDDTVVVNNPLQTIDSGGQHQVTSQGYPSTTQQQNTGTAQTYPQPTGQGQQQPQQKPSGGEESGRHPPHIHALNVDCSKEKMVVDLEFNEPFNGIVYSKGHHNSPECMHVNQGSARARFMFTLTLGTCGTQFIDEFATGKSAYLENTLVIQNEPGIVEVWDSIRSVRCLWEGSISQSLSSGLSIGGLNQELVTFSGDTGQARLEIQAGRGPFSYGATELVQIGDLMTLVLTVDGDNSFELRVGECYGKDAGTNSVLLTDDRGCPLKEKLMAGFQFTRHPQSGAAIAYAFFRAFKFPDVMDLTLECNVQLCKAECRKPCEDPNQSFEPTRRRRRYAPPQKEEDLEGSGLDMKLAHTIRVFLPQDLSPAGTRAIMSERDSLALALDRVCLTKWTFYASTASLGALAIFSCLVALAYWAKANRRKAMMK